MFSSMNDVIRKYSSVLMLILMSLVLVCLVADEYCDMQQLAKQAVATTSMEVIADDFDWDEDDDDKVVTLSSFDDNWSSIPMLETTSQKTEGSKCSQALLRGQVRRYSPRNSLPSSPKNVILKTIESGVDLFHATFFVPHTSLLTKNSNK